MNNGTTIRELSSVGSERLPYKQRVGGSNPSAPTDPKRRPLQKGWSSFSECPANPVLLRNSGKPRLLHRIFMLTRNFAPEPISDGSGGIVG